MKWGFFAFCVPQGGGKMNKVKAMMLGFSVLTAAAFFFGAGDLALAAGSVDGSISNAGITKAADTKGLFSSLKQVVYLIMGIGGVWSVAWLIIGGMLLSGSGSNAQKRTAGIAAILCACGGIYVIFKAYKIAGWATGIG